MFVAGYVAADYVRLMGLDGGVLAGGGCLGVVVVEEGGGRGIQSTNQFALGESVGRVYSHAQLGEEEGEEEHLHCEDVFCGLDGWTQLLVSS